MSTGNEGENLSYKDEDINTYISVDGGKSWREIFKGSKIYEIGDYGGLIVVADNREETNKIYFSWNYGDKWEEIVFFN